MPHEVGINIKVVDRLGDPQAAVTVNLLNLGDASVLRTGSTDVGGRTLFTGVTAGTYDLEAVGASGSQFIRNYVVKDTYSIVPGDSSFNFENRYSVRSGDGVPAPGIFTQNKETRQGILFGGQLQPLRVYGGNNINPDLMPVTGSRTVLNKQSGNSYYHLNQDVAQFQKAQILIG